jgi:hypothetical protein
MKEIPEIVKEHVLKTCGRMPESEKEVNDYLDLINHTKEYSEAYKIELAIGKKAMKKLGFKTCDEIKKEFKI